MKEFDVTDSEIKKILKDSVENKAFPGGVVVYGNNNLCHTVNAGKLTYGNSSTIVSPDTLYDIASLTKIVTTTVLLRLVAENRVGLDDFISKYIPYTGSKEITVRHILAHVSGLQLSLSSLKEHPKERIEEIILSTPPVTKPGDRFYYSNQGFFSFR